MAPPKANIIGSVQPSAGDASLSRSSLNKLLLMFAVPFFFLLSDISVYKFFVIRTCRSSRSAAVSLDGLAGKSELSAVRPFTNQSVSCATPMSVITASMIGVSMPSWSAMDAQQTRAMGNVLGEMAVGYIVRTSNGGQRMAAVSHGVHGLPGDRWYPRRRNPRGAWIL